MLNAALGVGIGLLVSWGTKKITEAAQRVQNVATKSKEAADAAQSTTSSLKDLVSAYYPYYPYIVGEGNAQNSKHTYYMDSLMDRYFPSLTAES